jgi:hypothetical protein
LEGAILLLGAVIATLLEVDVSGEDEASALLVIQTAFEPDPEYGEDADRDVPPEAGAF